MATSLEMGGNKDLRNQSSKNFGSTLILHMYLHIHHSCI
jgi:hypothetical protein